MNTLSAENQRKKLIMMKLQHTLTYVGTSALIFAGYSIIGYFVVITILTVTAIIYTPYLIKTLVQLKKWKWIIGFVIFVLGPMMLSRFVVRGLLLIQILSSITFFMYFLYCCILRYCLHDWIEEIDIAEAEMDFDE
ncbi:MAG: hypothetical protein JW794_07360 [Candidatus Cloacimonetes bacterium]|nr:hypothetical protein [Candidatus Cloacimonadota bacterium]